MTKIAEIKSCSNGACPNYSEGCQNDYCSWWKDNKYHSEKIQGPYDEEEFQLGAP